LLSTGGRPQSNGWGGADVVIEADTLLMCHHSISRFEFKVQ
jgi:hypothetical protein